MEKSEERHLTALTSVLNGKEHVLFSHFRTPDQQDRSGKSAAASSDWSRYLGPLFYSQDTEA